jgi:hypothetical protein
MRERRRWEKSGKVWRENEWKIGEKGGLDGRRWK